jgi:glycosyltransferase involved in cell wall biosynthesis
MRRVFILINNSGIGGAERRLGRLFARMAQEDVRALLVINAGLWKQLCAAGLVSGREARVVKLSEPFRRLAERLRIQRSRVGFWLRKLDYLLFACVLLVTDMLRSPCLLHLVLGGAYIGLPAKILRRAQRTIVSVVNADLSSLVGTPLGLPFYLFALKRCDLVDALSESVRADLVRRGIPADKILVSPGSVIDLERFRPAQVKKLWVVFAGRLIEEKNPMLFVEAAQAVHRAMPAAKFFLLGEGPLRPLLDRQISRLGLQDVIVMDFHADTAPILSHARVFASLQRQDNYPSQSLLEAMACGAVPVATDVGMTWRLVDETTGIRVKPDPGLIAEAVIGLLSDSSRCERLGEAARRRVAEQHSEEAYRRYLDGLYARANTV